MVAYSFKRQFIEPIQSGRKRQTIRGDRRRHARPGEPIQIYYALRTKAARKLLDPDPVCLSVERLLIDFRSPTVTVEAFDGPYARVYQDAKLEAFAQEDGFTGWEAMRAFWQEGHEGNELLSWQGVLIKWGPA